jgi:Camelysin metallo-endopeptidase
MDQTAPVHAHPRRRRRFAALLVLALVSGSLGAGALSLAIFTDSQAVTGNAFATGTIDISTTPTSALFSMSGMLPGDTKDQTIEVQNAANGALRYAISTAVNSGPALAAQLQLDIYAGATCSGTPLYSGALNAAAVGSNAQGPNDGDRELAGGDHETLCFKATLPLDTGNSFRNLSTAVTFTFDAEQVANNP